MSTTHERYANTRRLLARMRHRDGEMSTRNAAIVFTDAQTAVRLFVAAERDVTRALAMLDAEAARAENDKDDAAPVQR